MIDIISVVIAITFAIWIYFEVRDTLKTNKKYRDECDTRIEWFKNNMGLTSELQDVKVSIDLLSDYPFAFSGGSIDEDIV